MIGLGSDKNTASQNDLQMCYQIYAVMLMKNLFQIGPSPKLPLSLDMCKLVLSWSQQPYNHQFRVCWYKVKINKSSPFTVALITQLISKFIWIDFFHHHHTCDSTFIPNAVSTTDYDKTQQWVLKTKVHPAEPIISYFPLIQVSFVCGHFLSEAPDSEKNHFSVWTPAV